MTDEEREIIANFIARVAGAAAPPSRWGGASTVPATAPALPPIDSEADAFIAGQFQRYPEARYRLTQLAFVQEHALAEAQNRIKRLEWELQQTQQAAQQQASHSGGFLGGLFGGRSQSTPPPPPQSGPWGQPGAAGGYQAPPPPPNPGGYGAGVLQRQGSGFFGSALTTAAGVAGGVLAADAIRDLFSSHQGYAAGMAENPWASQGVAPTDPGYVDQGTWSTPDPGTGQPDPGYGDSGTWDPGTNAQSGWSDPGNDPSGGGWDQGGTDQGWDQGGGGGDDDSLI